MTNNVIQRNICQANDYTDDLPAAASRPQLSWISLGHDHGKAPMGVYFCHIALNTHQQHWQHLQDPVCWAAPSQTLNPQQQQKHLPCVGAASKLAIYTHQKHTDTCRSSETHQQHTCTRVSSNISGTTHQQHWKHPQEDTID